MKAAYLLVLVGCLVAAVPIELAGSRVLRRPRRLLLTLLPVGVVFLSWDIEAVHARQWSFDPTQVLGPRVAGLPVEELLFFLVIPVCAILTLEAARRVTGWRVGDET